jgi:hypothetical protein
LFTVDSDNQLMNSHCQNPLKKLIQSRIVVSYMKN